MTAITVKSALVQLVVVISFSDVLLANEDEYIRVVNFTDTQNYWLIDRLPAPRRATMKEKNADTNPGCVSVSFIIEPDGTTSSHEAVASFPSNVDDKRIIHMLKRARFNPSEQNEKREPIFTVMIINMSPIVRINGVQNEDSAELSRKVGDICKRKVDTWFAQIGQDKVIE